MSRKNQKNVATVAVPVTSVAEPVATVLTPEQEATLASVEQAVAAPKTKKASKSKTLATMTDVLAALYPEGTPVARPLPSLSWAFSLLSHKLPINQLPIGAAFSLEGRFGRFLELNGNDAKVEWDGKTSYWAAASEVRWAPELPIAAVKPQRVTRTTQPVTNGNGTQPVGNGTQANGNGQVPAPKAPRTGTKGSEMGEKAMKVLNGIPKKMAQIVKEAQLSDTVYTYLNRMAKEGKVIKTEQGYTLPA